MKTLKNRAERYLEKLDDRLGPFVPRPVPSLPLFLRERFSIFSTRLFGREWSLAVEADGWDRGTPAEYRQFWHQLQQSIREVPVAIVLPFVSATVRTRMVRMGIPFLIPNTQIFLPGCVTLLTESFGTVPPGMDSPLSPVAQMILLMQLEKGGLDKRSSKGLSARLGYSRASVSNATSELERLRLCETCRKGKEKNLSFKGSGKALWEAGLPLLRSPVAGIRFVSWMSPPPDAKRAGISALANQSQLAEDPVPVFALPEKRLRQGLLQGEFSDCTDRSGADAQLEAWRYNPALLTNGPDVDSLSLYLSLRNSPDERVQKALTAMMEDFLWR